MLIAWQCEERGLDPTYVAAFRKWNELGRVVRRGERALSILAPMPLRDRDEEDKRDRGRRGDGDEGDKPRVLFRRASVFDVSQTDPIPGTDPAPLQPPAQPICGSSHEHLITPLREHASTLGYRVEFNEIPAGGPSGWCDTPTGWSSSPRSCPPTRRSAYSSTSSPTPTASARRSTAARRPRSSSSA
ncbi:ArdC family protein [Svornostia abyssi]|uniref:ArdC family protein n=2 Tax=Svornostia abyssi TaxID=2898438 RepID=A0ABY5PEC0_9ACTN|nr:ArdC family protein [Parviterribacteraceae bacterium J379]